MAQEEGMAAEQNGGTGGRDEPLYNIGVVERMTGVPVATLRVWERRYGFPQSARTAGGHRIYSEREVARLRWVKARVDEGMQASKAVHALEVTEAQGRFPEPPRIQVPSATAREADPTLDAFHERLTAALLTHDTQAANRILGEVLALYPLEDLILGVVGPTLVDIGDGWAAGKVTVATEHLASQFLRERLLMWMPFGPVIHPVRPTVLACAPGEWHDLSLLMLGVLLRRRGWPVSYLGQAVPLEDLAKFVDETKPPAVVLVAMRHDTAAAIRNWPDHLVVSAETGRPPVCFGGRVFTEEPDWRETVPGLFLGESVLEGAERLDKILKDVTGIV